MAFRFSVAMAVWCLYAVWSTINGRNMLSNEWILNNKASGIKLVFSLYATIFFLLIVAFASAVLDLICYISCYQASQIVEIFHILRVWSIIICIGILIALIFPHSLPFPSVFQLQLAYQSCPALLSVSDPVAQSHLHISQFELHVMLFEASKIFNNFLIEFAVQVVQFAYQSSLPHFTPVVCTVCIKWSSLHGWIPSDNLWSKQALLHLFPP